MLTFALFLPALALAQTSIQLRTPANYCAEKSSSKALTISPNGVATGARAIHNSALIVDTHADTPGRFVDENFDLAQDAGTGYLDFNKIKAGNLGAEFFSIWVEPKANKGHETKRALDMIDSVYEQARRHPDKMMMAFSTQDILAAHRQHKLAALLGVEGGHAIEGDIRILRDYYRLGVRYMTLTWSNTNELGDSSGDIDDKSVEHHDGITDFGRQVVREMNRLGMMVDISHVADRTFYQALVASRAPVIASHSSSRALTNVPRNMTDDMLIALARNGGVAQVNFYCGFISQKYVDRGEAAQGAARSRLRESAVAVHQAANAGGEEATGRGQGRAGDQAAASAAQRPDRPHRPHGEGRRRRPRRSGLRFRRHRLLAAGN